MEENFPRVEIQNIGGLGISFKKGIAKISFEVLTPGPELFRLLYLQAMAQPLNVIVESPQLEMDLKLVEVKRSTGEVKGG